MSKVPEITPLEAEERLEQGGVFLLDVRNPDEYKTARIEGAVLIPLHELPRRMGEVPKDKPIIVHCHHGMRSMNAAMMLKQSGYADVVNLAGGIDAWSRLVDPTVPRY